MNDLSDARLLRDYAEHGSEAAFREIVERHADLLYSTALRQVESSDLAADITQSVFVDLARKAPSVGSQLSPDASLAGWLHRATRYASLNHWRTTQRRVANERLAMEQLLTNFQSPSDWEQIRPTLDEALDSLDDEDREALLLRYFKKQDFRAVGVALGINDDAAQKRVTRAVERLREFFSKRNATIGASGLAVLISANAVQSAPVGLVATISAAAGLTGTTVATSTVITATKTIAMTTLQKTFVTAAFVATIGAGIFEAHQAAQLRAQNQTLQQAQAPLADQVRQLQAELADATNRLASLIAENNRWQANSNELELLKLRGEVGRLLEANRQLSASTNDSRDSLIKSWLAREDQLKQFAQQYSNKAIPEFQLLSDKQWLDAAMSASFDTDTNVQQDLADLRRTAESNFAQLTQTALSKFAEANNGQFPTDLSQLQPYYSSPMDSAILQRWEIAPGSVNPGVSIGPTVITEISPVDAALDTRWSIGINVTGTAGYPQAVSGQAVTNH